MWRRAGKAGAGFIGGTVTVGLAVDYATMSPFRQARGGWQPQDALCNLHNQLVARCPPAAALLLGRTPPHCTASVMVSFPPKPPFPKVGFR